MKKMLGMFFACICFWSLMTVAQDFTLSNVSITTDLEPAAIGQNYSIDVMISFCATPVMPAGVDENDCHVEYLYNWVVDDGVLEYNYWNFELTLSSHPGEPLRNFGEHYVDVYVVGYFEWIDEWAEIQIRYIPKYAGSKTVTTFRFDSIQQKAGQPYYVDRDIDPLCSITYYSYANTDVELEITTDPKGYGHLFDVFVYHPLGEGYISKPFSNDNTYYYVSPVEYKSNYNVPMNREVDLVCSNQRNSSFSDGDVRCVVSNKIHLRSIFNCMKSNVRLDYAWNYARWKYGISIVGANSITASSTYSGYGKTEPDPRDVTLGVDAFDDEWTCASTLGHEIVHCNQPEAYFWCMYKNQSEMEAYDWELEHSDAPFVLCGHSPVTYIYSQCISMYNYVKSQYISYGGILPYP